MVWLILIYVCNEVITFLVKRWYFWTMSPFLCLQYILVNCADLEECIMALGKSWQKLRRDIAFLGSVLKETSYILLSLSPKGDLEINVIHFR